ncbi:MAG: hypothetical protein ACNA78_10825 [Balneolaceae bacterium]
MNFFKKLLSVSILVFAGIIFLPQETFSQSFAVKINGGSLGAGGEIAVKLNNSFNARAGGNFLNVDYLYETGADDEFDVDASLGLQNAAALIDWHPFKGSFRLSAGMIYNKNRITTDLLPKKNYQIGGDVITSDELGALQAELTFRPVSPMVSMGFGNVFRGSRFGVNVELGMVYQGSPAVAMQAEGLLAPSAEQADILEKNLEWFEAYPVFTLSLNYRIN